jgi:hypothetical protein
LPSYACYNGILSSPSKFFFYESSLIPDGLSFEDLTDEDILHIKAKRNELFEEVFGPRNPEASSKICVTSMHRTVARCLENEVHAKETEFHPEMLKTVLQFMAKTDGNKGNIYEPGFVEELIYVIHDFIEKRNEYFGTPEITTQKKPSFLEMARYEINALVHPKCPQNLNELYKGKIDVGKILKKIN